MSSLYGQNTRLGLVQLTVDGHPISQLEPTKAKEIGLFLIECAEAAISDQVLVEFLVGKLGVERDKAAMALKDVREIRQGTREAVFPS